MLQKEKNSFLIFLFWGGLFKISSYAIVGIHPDIKIEFFLKKYFGHTLQYPCKLNIVLFFFFSVMLQETSCMMRYTNLSVASCELSVDICQLRVDICQLRVDICQLRVDICQLSVASCELRVVS